jgi:hypothetical protein
MRNIAKILGALVLVLGATVLLTPVVHFKGSTVLAHVVPSPCDFTTGGGWILIPNGTASGLPESGDKANFGIVGGCKPDRFFGHVNYDDHNNGLHVSSDTITGYFDAGNADGSLPSKHRDICGTAETNLLGNVFFRVRTIDAEQQSPAPPKDKFGIKLIGQNPDGSSSGDVKYLVPTRCLASGRPTFDTVGTGTCSAVNPGGGDIELHKPAPPGTMGPNLGTPPPDPSIGPCGGDDSGLGF